MDHVLLARHRGRALLTIEETALVLGRSRSAAYEDARRGDLPTRRLGGRLFVPVPELLLWLGWPGAAVSDWFATPCEMPADLEERDALLITNPT